MSRVISYAMTSGNENEWHFLVKLATALKIWKYSDPFHREGKIFFECHIGKGIVVDVCTNGFPKMAIEIGFKYGNKYLERLKQLKNLGFKIILVISKKTYKPLKLMKYIDEIWYSEELIQLLYQHLLKYI